jgi:hypothetical protein
MSKQGKTIGGKTMTTADLWRSTSNRRRALGTVAGAVIAVATVVVGAPALGREQLGISYFTYIGANPAAAADFATLIAEVP